MAVVEMLSYTRDNLRSGSNTEENAVQEAAFAGFQTVEKLILMISNHQRQRQIEESSSSDDNNYTDVADAAVQGFRKFISLLDDRNRTGHARFRRGPISISPLHLETKILQDDDDRIAENQDPSGFTTPAPIHHQKVLLLLPPLPQRIGSVLVRKERAAENISFAAPSPPFISSFNSGDGADSSGFQITNMTQTSSGRPPISSASQKRKSNSIRENGADPCHCSKKRKSKVTSVVKVAAISSKMAEIPSDDCSWRKYGQKPIKGSPHPRGYYRCSSVRGCPAKKHVERSVNEPGILIVTYEGNHNHSNSVSVSPSSALESS